MGEPLSAATLPALTAVPGLVHGFELRAGRAGGESREQARGRVAAALAPHGRLLFLRQVHGAAVAEAPWATPPEADAAVAAEAGLLLAIETADCLPVLLVDRRRCAVAVAHAGWRGTAAGVVRCAVEALRATGSRAEDLVAGLGPAIGSCCYEVGEELRTAFGVGGADFFRPGRRGRPHLDLRAANVAQLTAAGVGAIHSLDECTFCHARRHPSSRRDGHGAGRTVSFVGFGRPAVVA